jgi:polyhydroxyalkanoate synthesis repressor PhaR
MTILLAILKCVMVRRIAGSIKIPAQSPHCTNRIVFACISHRLLPTPPKKSRERHLCERKQVLQEDYMAKNDGQIVIKKYANRRLYNTGTSTYVTLDDLAQMVKRGEDFTVQDAKSGDDITHSVLTQIIFEQESKNGNTLLPISFLRQLISYYGDQMQTFVPSYLEQSMHAFGEQQVQIREHMAKTLGDTPIAKNLQIPMQLMEEQIKRNTEIFRQAMEVFTPFTGTKPEARETPRKADAKDVEELKEQLRALQSKIENM